MDRRQFLGSAVAGLSLPLWNGWVFGAETPAGAMGPAIPTTRPPHFLIPQPEPGLVIQITPPGFCWLPASEAVDYRLRIQDDAGRLVYESQTGPDPLHLPDRVLPAGRYRWDVQAIGRDGQAGEWRGWQPFQIAEGAPELPRVPAADLLARVPAEHPRILYPRHMLPELRASLTTTRRRAWAQLREAADSQLSIGTPVFPEYQKIKDRNAQLIEYVKYFQYFRRFINNALQNLSLAWLMSEDPKYAEAAKKILLEVAGWPTDDDDVTSLRSRTGDEIGLSLSKVGHLAYDWLYDALDESERDKVRRMCVARTDQSYRWMRDSNFPARSANSHLARLIGYLPEQSLVLAHEAEGPEEWLDWALRGLTTFYPHWGGRDGGWAEGISYGLAYNGFYVPSFEALDQLTGYNLWQRPFFRNLRHFFLYCKALNGEMSPYGDAQERGASSINGTPEGLGALMQFHAHRYQDPHTAWMVANMEHFESTAGSPWMMLHPDELPAPKAPSDLPQSRAFHGVGWAGLHSDLADIDNDTFMVFKSSPFGSVSHSHADQNSFVIMKGGRALAISSGYYQPAYGLPHHVRWSRQTKAHNNVLVNGEGQAANRDQDATGRLARFEDRPGFSYLIGDAVAAYKGLLERYDRHILFLRPGLFLLLDDLAAPAPAEFQWLLHALEQMELDQEAGRIVSRRDGRALTVWLRQQDGRSIAIPSLGQTDQFETPVETGTPPDYTHNFPNQWHMTARTLAPAAATRIGAIMAVTGPGETPPAEPTAGPAGWFGIKLGQTEGWVQLTPGAPGPEGFGERVGSGQALLCARDRDGTLFSA